MFSSMLGGSIVMCLQMSRVIKFRMFALATLLNGVAVLLIVVVPWAMADFDRDV